MIGLLWKDIFVARKTLRFYALFLLSYWILALLGIFDFYFVTSVSMIIIMVLPLSSFAYDEQVKWTNYTKTFPLSPAKIVGARYLLLLLLTVVIFTISAALSIVVFPQGGEDLANTLISLLTSMGAGLFISDLMFPLSYKLGVERARPFLMGIIFLPMIGAFLLYKLGVFDQIDLSYLERLSSSGALGLVFLIILLNVVGVLLSFWISCRLFSKKEF